MKTCTWLSRATQEEFKRKMYEFTVLSVSSNKRIQLDCTVDIRSVMQSRCLYLFMLQKYLCLNLHFRFIALFMLKLRSCEAAVGTGPDEIQKAMNKHLKSSLCHFSSGFPNTVKSRKVPGFKNGTPVQHICTTDLKESDEKSLGMNRV